MSLIHRTHYPLAALDRAPVWLNSDPLTADELRGRVVLVDFWTYSCVNWLRALPYVRARHERYRERGLVVVGAHAPEFGFEHDLDVRRAASELDVGYPVVIDNDFRIWRSFDDNYWPALYLVDGEGRVRYQHFGEGAYDEIERAIQRLPDIEEKLVRVDAGGLAEAADRTNAAVTRDVRRAYPRRAPQPRPPRRRPRAEPVGARRRLVGRLRGGRARIHPRLDRVPLPGPRPQPRPRASDPGAPVRFRVSLDGLPPGDAHGLVVDASGEGTVAEPRMYQLVRQHDAITPRTFEITFHDPGVHAYVFTFG